MAMTITEYFNKVQAGHAVNYVAAEAYMTSPALYKATISGADGTKPFKRTSNLWDAYRYLVTHSPEEFGKKYLVANGPINDRTGNPFGRDTDKFRNWYEKEVKAFGLELITIAEAGQLRSMYQALRQQLKVHAKNDENEIAKNLDVMLDNPPHEDIFVEAMSQEGHIDIPLIAHFDMQFTDEAEAHPTFFKFRPTSRYDMMLRDLQSGFWFPDNWNCMVLSQDYNHFGIVYALQESEFPHRCTFFEREVTNPRSFGSRAAAVVKNMGTSFRKDKWPINISADNWVPMK